MSRASHGTPPAGEKLGVIISYTDTDGKLFVLRNKKGKIASELFPVYPYVAGIINKIERARSFAGNNILDRYAEIIDEEAPTYKVKEKDGITYYNVHLGDESEAEIKPLKESIKDEDNHEFVAASDVKHEAVTELTKFLDQQKPNLDAPVIVKTSTNNHNCLLVSMLMWWLVQSQHGDDATKDYINEASKFAAFFRELEIANVNTFDDLAGLSVKEIQVEGGKALRTILAELLQTNDKAKAQHRTLLESFLKRMFDLYLDDQLADSTYDDVFNGMPFVKNQFEELKTRTINKKEKHTLLSDWWEREGHDQYVEHISKPGVFLGGPEAAVLAEHFGFNLRFMQNGFSQLSGGNNQQLHRPTITVRHTDGNHWEGYLPKQLVEDYDGQHPSHTLDSEEDTEPKRNPNKDKGKGKAADAGGAAGSDAGAGVGGGGAADSDSDTDSDAGSDSDDEGSDDGQGDQKESITTYAPTTFLMPEYRQTLYTLYNPEGGSEWVTQYSPIKAEDGTEKGCTIVTKDTTGTYRGQVELTSTIVLVSKEPPKKNEPSHERVQIVPKYIAEEGAEPLADEKVRKFKLQQTVRAYIENFKANAITLAKAGGKDLTDSAAEEKAKEAITLTEIGSEWEAHKEEVFDAFEAGGFKCVYYKDELVRGEPPRNKADDDDTQDAATSGITAGPFAPPPAKASQSMIQRAGQTLWQYATPPVVLGAASLALGPIAAYMHGGSGPGLDVLDVGVAARVSISAGIVSMGGLLLSNKGGHVLTSLTSTVASSSRIVLDAARNRMPTSSAKQLVGALVAVFALAGFACFMSRWLTSGNSEEIVNSVSNVLGNVGPLWNTTSNFVLNNTSAECAYGPQALVNASQVSAPQQVVSLVNNTAGVFSSNATALQQTASSNDTGSITNAAFYLLYCAASASGNAINCTARLLDVAGISGVLASGCTLVNETVSAHAENLLALSV